jgi:hypothetical protein
MCSVGIVRVTGSGRPVSDRRDWQHETPRPDPNCRHRFPAEVIRHAVWLYHVFSLSFREVELLLSERGAILSYETVRSWCKKFGQTFACESAPKGGSGAKLMLDHRHRSRRAKKAGFEQIKTGTTVHLSLHELQFCVLPFGRSGHSTGAR